MIYHSNFVNARFWHQFYFRLWKIHGQNVSMLYNL